MPVLRGPDRNLNQLVSRVPGQPTQSGTIQIPFKQTQQPAPQDPFNIQSYSSLGSLDDRSRALLEDGLRAYFDGIMRNANIIGGIQGNLGATGDKVNALTSGVANTVGTNVAGNQDWLQNQYNILGGMLNENPYTDQMRQSNLAGINNQIQTELQSLQNQTRRGAAASGVGGSLAGGAQAQLQGQAIGARANAARQTLQDQLMANQQAQQYKAGLLGQIAPAISGQNLAGQETLLGAAGLQVNPQLSLAGMQSSAAMAGLQDPMQVPNMIGGATGMSLAQENAQRLMDFANQQQKQQQAAQNSWWNPLGVFGSLFFPGQAAPINMLTNWLAQNPSTQGMGY